MDDLAAPDRPPGAPEPDAPTAPLGVPGPEPHARAFVWLAFALLFALDLACMIVYTPHIPIYDDYEMIPSYAGDRPLTVGWLWSLSNEHRVFLPRLIHVIDFRLSGGDFRPGVLLSLASLAAAAATLIEVARRLRGYQRYADMFLPIVLLNPSHLESLTWAWELVHVVPSAIACLLLGFIVTRDDWPTARGTVGFALGLTLLPLISGTGLILTPAPLAWLMIAAVARWRSGEKLQGALIFAMTLPALALIGLYFRGYARPTYIPQRGTRFEMCRTFAEFITVGFGPGVKWNYREAFVAISCAVGLGGLMTAWAFLRRPSERPRALGLLAFLASCGVLAAAVGVNRSGFGAGAGLALRYVAPAIPLLCWVYFSWELYAPSLPRTFVQLAMFLASVSFFSPNWGESRDRIRHVRDTFAGFESDVRKGGYIYEIARRHSRLIFGPDDPTAYLEALQRAKIRPFDQLRENPKFREVPLPVAPSLVEHATWDEATKTILVEGRESRVTFSLPEPIKVAGIRMGYSLDGPQGSGMNFVISWRPTEQDPYSKDRSLEQIENRIWIGGDRTTTFWVDDVVGQFRIAPDVLRCKFRVNSITLLVVP